MLSKSPIILRVGGGEGFEGRLKLQVASAIRPVLNMYAGFLALFYFYDALFLEALIAIAVMVVIGVVD